MSKNEDEQDFNPTQYKRLIGSFRYLCNTQLTLAFSVDIVRRFMERPKLSHLAGVKRIQRYIKGSIGYEILFPSMDKGRKYNLLGFAYSIWCGDKDDRKSTAGYIFMFGETQISWCPKKEQVVAPSACEAEYNTVSLCVYQAVWLMNFLKDLDNKKCDIVTLMVDNVPATNLAKNPIVHERSKPIEMRFHYFRELVSQGRLRFEYCRSEDQVTDLLTEGVIIEVFKRLKKNMGMKDLEHMN